MTTPKPTPKRYVPKAKRDWGVAEAQVDTLTAQGHDNPKLFDCYVPASALDEARARALEDAATAIGLTVIQISRKLGSVDELMELRNALKRQAAELRGKEGGANE